MSQPFQYLLRVRYHECDGQKVVFNARYAEYVDVAALEYTRALFGAVLPEEGGFDWRLVHQSMDWKAPASFDEVLVVEIQTTSVGNTSFTLSSKVRRREDHALLVCAKTVYVVYDEKTAAKAQISEINRKRLLAGSSDTIVDCTGRQPG